MKENETKNTDGAQRNRNTSLFEELLRESSAETEAKAGSGQTDDGSIFENTADNTKTENYSNTLTDDYENGTSFTNDETIDSYIKIPQRKTISSAAAARFAAAADNEEPAKQKKKSGLGLAFKIIIPLILVAAAAFVFLKMPDKAAKQCDSEYKALAQLVSNDSASSDDGKLLKYSKLKAKNADFTGFLTLPDADYGYPVASQSEQSDGYYSQKLFSGEKNRYGCLNTAESIEPQQDITVIRGNDLGDKRMLGRLYKFLEEDYVKLHPTVDFDSEYSADKWLVFAAFTYKDSEPFYIDRVGFLNDGVKTEYIEKLKKASVIKLNIAADNADELLVLVAKGEKKTIVAAARKLREGEDALSPVKDDETIQAASATVSSGKSASSASLKSSGTSSKSSVGVNSTAPDSKAAVAPVPKNTGRYEQTGLTENMDKTVKVNLSQVVTMVNVTGLSKAQAQNVLKSTLGLKVEVKEEESEEERGTVIAQSVADGAEISSDVTVTITVSIGVTKGETIVPELIGNAKSNLETVLSKNNLRLGKVTTEKSSLEKGTVLSQSVDSGKTVKVNTKINVTVSDGSVSFKTVKMPKLTGKTSKKAQEAIKKAGLRVGTISTVASSKSAGTVVNQECAAGTKIEEGTTVSFGISNGSKVNNLTVTNQSSWSVTVNGKTYGPGAVIKGDYMDIIPCIIEAEMGSGCHIEALKAQAVAAYCWLINAGSKTGAAPPAPMKNPGSRAVSAAKAVNGVKATYGGSTAQTYYYAISAGYSANCKDVWYADLPYLRAVESPGDRNASGFKTTVTYSASELASRVKKTYGVDLSKVAKSKWFKVTYDENGAYARSINIGGKKTVNGSSFRDTLLDYELRSTAFKINYSGGKFTFTVYGYGHGVGMSQVGAEYYASKGRSYVDILKHYYRGVSVG